MGVRGRKSSAELTVVQRAADVLVVKRPEPPACLSDEAAGEWRAVVDTFSADHFNRAIHPLLEAYCTHAAEMRRIERMRQEMVEMGEGSTGEYIRLLNAYESQTRALQSLAVRLRIANATHIPKSARAIVASKPLWER